MRTAAHVQEARLGARPAHGLKSGGGQQSGGLLCFALFDQRLAQERVRVGENKIQTVLGRQLDRGARFRFGARDLAAAQRDVRLPRARERVAGNRPTPARVAEHRIDHTVSLVKLIDKRQRPRRPGDLDRLSGLVFDQPALVPSLLD